MTSKAVINKYIEDTCCNLLDKIMDHTQNRDIYSDLADNADDDSKVKLAYTVAQQASGLAADDLQMVISKFEMIGAMINVEDETDGIIEELLAQDDEDDLEPIEAEIEDDVTIKFVGDDYEDRQTPIKILQDVKEDVNNAVEEFNHDIDVSIGILQNLEEGIFDDKENDNKTDAVVNVANVVNHSTTSPSSSLEIKEEPEG